jgi:hypothetical protein
MKSGSSALELIWGVTSIAAEVNRTPRATYRLLEQGVLPGKKVGGIWASSRPWLRRYFDPALSGEDVRQGGRGLSG